MFERTTALNEPALEALELSDRALSVWAKSFYDHEWRISPMRLSLVEHLLDTADVMAYLFDEWVPPSVSDLAARQFPGLDAAAALEEIRNVAIFLAASHDVGKCSAAFASKEPVLADEMASHGLTHEPDVVVDRRHLPHGLAGDRIVAAWLRGRSVAGASALASVVGGHHGIPPSGDEIVRAEDSPVLFGGDVWFATACEILDHVVTRLGLDGAIARWASVAWAQPTLVLLTGWLIVADWLASNSAYFPLRNAEDDIRAALHPEARAMRVEAALSRIELPARWEPSLTDGDADALLRDRFELPADARATRTQRAAVEAAQRMELPGLLVIEDVMGSGKTEAALMAAEIMAARSGRRGCLFALPTQATTDAMFARQLTWLERMLPETSVTSAFAAQLMHGRANLNEEASALRRAGFEIRDRLLGQLPEPAVADEQSRFDREGDLTSHHRLALLPWFSGRKKSILADFVVSTVDHVLFGAMRAPHLALRHVGLERKVVIIDEVHSYSSYMNTYLERALEWLGAYGVPVILLSATLSRAQSGRFVGAYRAGVQSQGSSRRVRPEMSPIETSYPCLVIGGADGATVVDTSMPVEGRPIRLRHLPPRCDVADLLSAKLAEGGTALVVRNTVSRAQSTYEALRERFGADVELMHSRFTVADRQRKDEHLLRRFGHPRKAPQRPRRAVIVATQVVEQSLDVDFDLLITDLAPVDLLLQRIGRLHRHERNRPAKLGVPECYVEGLADPDSADPYVERGAAAVYGRSVLLRSAAAVHRVIVRGGWLTLPDDVASLIEEVYGPESNTPQAWSEALAEAERQQALEDSTRFEAARQFLLKAPLGPQRHGSLHGWLSSAAPEEVSVHGGIQARAQVRDSDESIEVILLEREGDTLLTLPASPGERGLPVPTDRVPEPPLVRHLARSSVRLPRWCATDAVIDELEASSRIDAWQSNPLLRGQLLLAIEGGVATLAGRRLSYDSELGLRDVRS